MDDEPFYEQVAAEIAAGQLKPGLWAKAFSEAGGNETAAKAIYIRLRANQLLTDARQTVAAVRREERAATWPERRARLGRRIIGGVLLSLAALFSLAIFAGGDSARGGIILALFFGIPGYLLVRK